MPAKSASAKKSTLSRRAPADFLLGEAECAFAAAQGLDPAQIHTQWGKFQDHEYRVAKRDWPAAWRTWCRNAVEYQGRATGFKTAAEKTSDTVARYAQRLIAKGIQHDRS